MFYIRYSLFLTDCKAPGTVLYRLYECEKTFYCNKYIRQKLYIAKYEYYTDIEEYTA